MMDGFKLNSRIAPPDEAAAREATARWNGLAKPVGSLGLFEDALTRIAALTASPRITLYKRAVLVLCADNGVVDEGVTQTGREVTAEVAGNMARGKASVCCMARAAHADVFPVDVGMTFDAPGVQQEKLARGTANFTRGPAMTAAQAELALDTGIRLVKALHDDGYKIIATGEMGIGNTTTASAMVSVLCGLPAADVTGRGAGLSDAGLTRKLSAIQRGIAVNRPDPHDAFDVLKKLGGFDIACMAGAFIGGAIYRVPMIIDGFISAVAALAAARICPACTCAMLASHVSAEPAAAIVLNELGLTPVIHANMRLGEGTGALCLLSLLDMALSVYDNMVSFGDIGIAPYTEPTV